MKNSSINLLKTICILLVIMHHFFIHGNLILENNITSIFNYGFAAFFGSFGKTACLVFVTITGYFMIKKNVKIDKLLLLFLQTTIYSLLIYIVAITLDIIPLSMKGVIKSLFSLIFGNWFIISYIQLYLLIPFVNKLIQSLNKKTLFLLISLLTFFYFGISSFISVEVWKLSNIGYFIIMYMIGAYIRLYGVNDKLNKYCILLLFLLGIIVFLIDITGIYFSLKLGVDFVKRVFSRAFGISSILSFFISTFVFIYFEKREFNLFSKLLNYISSSSLGIYLIHDNYIIRSVIWTNIMCNNILLCSKYFIILYIAKILVLFIVCLIIDKILMFPIKKLSSYIKKKLLSNNLLID